MTYRPALLCAAATSALGLATLAGAQNDRPEFDAPERILAGEKFLGEGRLYPSPKFHDVDGDGQADLVIGDLMGNVTYAKGRVSSDEGVTFGPEEPLKGADGKQLKFHNW